MTNPLLDAAGLQERLGAGLPTVLLDVRWALGDPHGRRHYVREHLPGAVYVDLPTELAAPAAPGRGRHPLPAAADFEAAARSWGINRGDVVVVYDDTANQSAARAWWLLRNAGLAEVYLLDGGLAAWRAAGLPLAAGPVTPEPGNVALTEWNMPVIETAAAAGWPEGGLLLDARAAERYRGDLEPVDPRPGHIPGAISAPTAENVDGTGRFLPPDLLRRRFEALGLRDDVPVAVYCGSGVTASHEVAALELAGFRAALYPGSFSQWSSTPDLPVATGPEPAGGAAGAAKWKLGRAQG